MKEINKKKGDLATDFSWKFRNMHEFIISSIYYFFTIYFFFFNSWAVIIIGTGLSLDTGALWS